MSDSVAAPRSGRPVLTFLSSLAIALALTGVARRTTGGVVPDGRRDAGPARASETPGGQDRSAGDPHAAAREPGRGREADHPGQIPARGWWDIAKRLYGEISEDRILAVAAGVTFYGLLAMFPAIAAFVSLYGLIADPGTITEHLSALGGFLPSGALDIIKEQVLRITSKGDTTLGFAFFSGLAVSLWSANAGMKAVFDALNIAYDETEKRNFFWLNVWSLAFTVGMVLLLVVAIGVVLVVPVALKLIGLGDFTEWLLWAGRWPVLLLAVLGAIALLYRYGPSRDRAQWRWLTPGSTLAALGLLVFSMLFSWYVGSFGNYNETYGSLGAAIGFMTWMWLSATILLVGAELNAETEHQTAEDTTEGPAKPLGSRGAQMADTVGRSA